MAYPMLENTKEVSTITPHVLPKLIHLLLLLIGYMKVLHPQENQIYSHNCFAFCTLLFCRRKGNIWKWRIRSTSKDLTNRDSRRYVKHFEDDDKILLNTYFVVRVDGKGFHKYPQGSMHDRLDSQRLMDSISQTTEMHYS